MSKNDQLARLLPEKSGDQSVGFWEVAARQRFAELIGQVVAPVGDEIPPFERGKIFNQEKSAAERQYRDCLNSMIARMSLTPFQFQADLEEMV
jgi:hypothetical protein